MNVAIAKVDAPLRTVFGWVLLTEVDGIPYVDKQGDIVTEDSLERAAIEFVFERGTVSIMHRRTPDGEPVKIGKVVESVVISDAKLKAMGLPIPESVGPRGWWVGVKFLSTPEADAVWERVKRGELKGFSIGGKGVREVLEE